MVKIVLVVFVMLFSAVSAAEVGQSEAEGLTVLRGCVKQFDVSHAHHRAPGVTMEELGACLLEARGTFEAELELIRDFRMMPVPSEAGAEGVRMVAITSIIALEEMSVINAIAAIESLRKLGPRWLEEDPIASLRAVVGPLEAARKALSALVVVPGSSVEHSIPR